MTDIAIRAEGLSKQYRIGTNVERYRTLRDSIARAASAPVRLARTLTGRGGPRTPKYTPIWALRDVGFQIKSGEAVGIIGRNGAGKSTLLKILSRITEPTKGYAEVHGRVGSLLEVGTGFHPELTGRENIFLNGAILGMKRAEIESKFDEIVAFSEVETFIDTPVKHYSSGMYLRLAFAVAAHLEPEVLLIDEVLAVGDARFQSRCLGKMAEVSKQGRTVLFVSHNMAAVCSLCARVIWLDDGRVARSGTPQAVIEEYLTRNFSAVAEVDLRQRADRRGSGESRIAALRLSNARREPTDHFEYGDEITFELTVDHGLTKKHLLACVEVRTATGVPVLHMVSSDDPHWAPPGALGVHRISCTLPTCLLYPGLYIVSVWLGASHYDTVDYAPDAISFRVNPGGLLFRGFEMTWQKGVFHCPTTWSVHPQIPYTPGALAEPHSGRTVSDE